jgi:TrbL/VirB6 plasmid conjugal transfer protein.
MLLQVSNGTDALVDFLFKASIIDDGINKVISAVTVAATILAAIFYFLNLGYNYAITTLKSIKDKNVEYLLDYEELGRTIVIVCCILVYPLIANTVDSGMDFFNKFTNASSHQMQEYEKMVGYANNEMLKQNLKEKEDSLTLVKACNDHTLPDAQRNYACAQLQKLKNEQANSKTTVQPQKQDEMSVWQSIKYYANPVNWIKISLGMLTGLLSSIIRIIISCITINVLKVLFCLGPLAFAFSILPPYKNQITIWFSTVLNTGFVFTTMNVLDAVFYQTMFYSSNVIKNSGGIQGASNYYAVFAMNVTFIILYLMSFWLTSKYVGKGDAGRVLSKAAGVATAAVGGAMMAGGGGAGVSNVANVTKSANDIISGD